MVTLQNAYLSLSIDDNACLTSFAHLPMQTGNLITRPVPLFRAILHNGDNWEDIAYADRAELTVFGEGEQGMIHVTALNTDMGRSEVELLLSVRLDGEKIWFEAEVRNHSEAAVNELFWPCLGALRSLGGGKTGLYAPSGVGHHYTDIAAHLAGVGSNGGSKRINLTYPDASMQWLMLHDEEKCLYLSGRDDQLMVGTMTIAGSPEGDICLEMNKYAFVEPNERWQSPAYLLWFYAGTWQRGAEEYRAWTDSWRHPTPLKSWMKDMTGFCLVINKQQYGDEVWSYHDIPRLYEIAQEHGCNTLGLFGWFDSGHDNFYPDLTVSETMGGEAALREGLQKVHEMGGRVVLYFQGHLIDVNTPYFISGKGLKAAGKNYVGQPYFEHYCKYSQSEFNRYYGGRTFATACPWSEDWHDLLAEKAEWIYGLGADGVLFDQTGGIIPYPCFDPTHGHPKPSLSFGLGRTKLLSRIRETVDRHDDFCLMVEIMTDAYSQFIDCVHGSVNTGRGDRLNAQKSAESCSYAMPELFRHTFPETKSTHRVAKPYMVPRYINGAICYGVVYEFEIRYLMDREYVEDNRHPEWKAYAVAVTKLRQRHPELLLTGRYSCDPDFERANPALKHGVFTAGDKRCAVFWNDNGIDLPLDLCGRAGVSWETPYAAGTDIPDTIAADSILVVFF